MRQTTLVLLIILAGSVFTLWFFGTHVKVSHERYVGFRGAAKVNDHLAAQMLLQELGFDAESKATLTPTEWLPPASDTVFIRLTPSLTIGDERDAILNWVSGGGHLILRRAQQRVQDDDLFLETLGLTLVEAGSEAAYSEAQDEEASARDEYELTTYWDEHRIELLVENTNTQIITDEGTVVVARREWGQGLITVIANPDYFNNGSLSLDDHSRFFADIVAGAVEPGKIWLIYQTTFSPLWQVIWRSALYLVLGLTMLFVLWLWSVMPVFGPRIRAKEMSRRSIIEHIRAAGIFIWRHHGGDCLVTSSTQALLHEAESRHPGIGRQPIEMQAENIARMTGMSAQKVLDVLNGQADMRPREFTHSMQRLQSIRKEL